MVSFFNAWLTAQNYYGFQHSVGLEARPGDVWDVLTDFRAWPGWWNGLQEIQRLDAGTLARGSRIRSAWQGRLPYSLTFDAVIRDISPGKSLSFFVTGDLSGAGDCRLLEVEEGTQLEFSWQVAPTRLWFRMSAPIARSVFKENHDRMMVSGGRGLTAELRLRRTALEVTDD
ncbi:MAG: SRPBCC family protein [Desulfobacterales bacterium]|nr:SRPBCC family protein [Desulfobacterales bacterium]